MTKRHRITLGHGAMTLLVVSLKLKDWKVFCNTTQLRVRSSWPPNYVITRYNTNTRVAPNKKLQVDRTYPDKKSGSLKQVWTVQALHFEIDLFYFDNNLRHWIRRMPKDKYSSQINRIVVEYNRSTLVSTTVSIDFFEPKSLGSFS